MTTIATQPTAFRASRHLAEDLQAVLTDLIALALQAKHAHWNVVGPRFRSTHRQLDELAAAATDAAETIAERLRALGAVAHGQAATVAASTTLTALPDDQIPDTAAIELAARSTRQTVATVRGVRDAVDAEDPASADLLHAVITSLEAQAWLLESASDPTT